MRQILSLFILLFVFLQANLIAQDFCSPDSLMELSQFDELYRIGHIYIGPQPEQELLLWLEGEGVKEIVNLKTNKENRKYKRKEYDEAEFILSTKMHYTSLPVGSLKKQGPKDKLGAFSEILNRGDTVFLHCHSGARVRYFLMEYLVREKNCEVDSAKQLVKKMGYYVQLDYMLGSEEEKTVN